MKTKKILAAFLVATVLSLGTAEAMGTYLTAKSPVSRSVFQVSKEVPFAADDTEDQKQKEPHSKRNGGYGEGDSADSLQNSDVVNNSDNVESGFQEQDGETEESRGDTDTQNSRDNIEEKEGTEYE